jgi:hypothetical protein
MDKPWISCFQNPTYTASTKHYNFPIFGYIINHNYTKEQKSEIYKRYILQIKKQNERLHRYQGADER